MSTPTQFWRYYLPSIKGEGYAVIFLDSAGVFSVVSDWGNYGYIWGNHGCKSIKHFLVKCHKDWDYLAGKFNPTRVTDYDKTIENIKDRIRTYLEDGCYTEDFATRELELIERIKPQNELEFHDWYLETELQDAAEYVVMIFNPQVEMFCKKVIPRLVEILKKELEAEEQTA